MEKQPSTSSAAQSETAPQPLRRIDGKEIVLTDEARILINERGLTEIAKTDIFKVSKEGAFAKLGVALGEVLQVVGFEKSLSGVGRSVIFKTKDGRYIALARTALIKEFKQGAVLRSSSSSDPLPAAPEQSEKPQRNFKTLTANAPISEQDLKRFTETKERNGYKIGETLFILKDRREELKRLLLARGESQEKADLLLEAKFTIIGFGYLKDTLCLQINDSDTLTFTEGSLSLDFFEKEGVALSKASKEKPKRNFKGLSGFPISQDYINELGNELTPANATVGYKVGDAFLIPKDRQEEIRQKLLRFSPYTLQQIDQIFKAKELIFLGLDVDGDPVLQIDDSDVIFYIFPEGKSLFDFFERKSPDSLDISKEKPERKFKSPSGFAYGDDYLNELSKVDRRTGYKAGEVFLIPEDLREEIRKNFLARYTLRQVDQVLNAKEFTFLGYDTADGEIALQAGDSDTVFFLNTIDFPLDLFERKSADSEKNEGESRTIFDSYGDSYEVSGVRERNGIKVGEIWVSSNENRYLIEGFTEDDRVVIRYMDVDIDDDPDDDIYAVPISSFKGLYTKETVEEGAPKVLDTVGVSRPSFESVAGGPPLEALDIEEFGGYRIGEKLKIKEGVRSQYNPSLSEEILESQNFKIVAFTEELDVYYDSSDTVAIIEIDGGKYDSLTIEDLEEFFDKESTEAKRIFKDIYGGDIIASQEITEDFGYKIGDKLKLRIEPGYVPFVSSAVYGSKQITVVGFAEAFGGTVAILQLDDGRCETVYTDSVTRTFDKVEAQESPAILRDLGSGQEIIFDPGVTERFGYKIGDGIEVDPQGKNSFNSLIPPGERDFFNRPVKIAGFQGDVICLSNGTDAIVRYSQLTLGYFFRKQSVPETANQATAETRRTVVDFLGKTLNLETFTTYEGVSVGDTYQLPGGSYRGLDGKVEGFTMEGRVVIKSDTDGRFRAYDFSFFEDTFVKAERRRLVDSFGVSFELTGAKTYEGISVGDTYEIADARFKNGNGKVEGFTDIDRVVLKSDTDGKFRTYDIDFFKESFAKVEGSATPPEVIRTVIDYFDNARNITELKTYEGISVGDAYKLSDSEGATTLDGKVEGFTDDDRIVIKSDTDGNFRSYPLGSFRNAFIKVENSGTASEIRRTVTDETGVVIEVLPDTEYIELAVGNEYYSLLAGTNISFKIEGFTEDGFVAARRSSDNRVVRYPISSFRETFIKVEDTKPDVAEREIENLLEEVALDLMYLEKQELGEEGLKERAAEARKEMGRRLRESPSMQALFKLVRGTPDLFAELKKVTARRKEFLNGTVLEGYANRGLTALFAGLNLSSRSAELFNEAIDRQFERETVHFLEQIENGNRYVPELVIGSGPASIIYNSERFARLPEDPALTIEEGSRVGGLFARVADAVWRLNSRTRPRSDLPNLPGTAGELNTLGSSVLGQADIEGMQYGTQDGLANAVRASHAPVSKIATSVEFVKARLNSDTSQGGKYEAELLDKRTGKTFYVCTDRIVTLTGLGKERKTLDREGDDDETKDIIENSGKVYTLPELVEKLGDKSEAFPLRGIKRPIVIGAKDSGNIVVGALLGTETQLRKTTTQLDFIDEVSWIGQELMTKEEVDRCLRIRYQELGLSFPREDKAGGGAEYYSRVMPTGAARAVRMERRSDETIRVYYQLIDKDTRRPILGIDRRPIERYVEGDAIFLTTGFENDLDERFAPLYNEVITDKNEIRENRTDFLENPGSVIFYEKPSVDQPVRFESVEPDNENFPFKGILTFNDGSRKVVGGSANELLGRYVNGMNIARLERSTGSVPEKEFVYESVRIDSYTEISRQGLDLVKEGTTIYLDDPDLEIEKIEIFDTEKDEYDFTVRYTVVYNDGTELVNRRIITELNNLIEIEAEGAVISAVDVRIQSSPIAYKLPGRNIEIAGAAATLPLTDEERENAPVLAKITENTAAIFRQEGKVGALGIQNARDDARTLPRRQRNLAAERPGTQTIVLPDPFRKLQRATTYLHTASKAEIGRPLPDEFVDSDFLRLAIGDRLGNLQFPSGIESLKLRVSRDPSPSEDPDKISFAVDFTPAFPQEYQVIPEMLFDDPVSRKILEMLTNPSLNSSRRVDIELPIIDVSTKADDYDGRIDIANIGWKVGRQVAKERNESRS